MDPEKPPHLATPATRDRANVAAVADVAASVGTAEENDEGGFDL